MPYDYRPAPSKSPPPGGSQYLTAAQRDRFYAAAPPTEQLPKGLPPASLTGQLRVLELQRATLDRDIAQLRAQLLQEASPPRS